MRRSKGNTVERSFFLDAILNVSSFIKARVIQILSQICSASFFYNSLVIKL